MEVSSKVGEDSEGAWNDKHFQHCWIWLTKNPNSPYFGSPAMLLTALYIAKPAWQQFKKSFRTGNLSYYRFGVRMRMTRAFKNVLNGTYEPVVLKRNSRGIIIKYEVRKSDNPKPIPCPPFYRGSIKITTKGMTLSLRRTDASMATFHDPEGLQRLTNPFGRV